MSTFIGIPAKRTSDVDLVAPLKNLISTYYGSDEAYVQSIQELNRLRKDCTAKGIESKSTSTLTALQRYYDQLKLFSNKCPVNEVPINFKWKDAFDKGGYFLSSSPSLIIQSLAYEKVCILFNIASSLSDIAATSLNEDVKNEHALQLAAKYFQSAAGVFLDLKVSAPAAIGTKASSIVDLNSSVLDILHYIMLAQAQESVFLKAMQNNMTDAILAKVANQCSEFYSESYKLIQIIKSTWPEKEWLTAIYCKHLFFSAIAQYHQALVVAEGKNFGEEIARLQHAVESFQQAEAKNAVPIAGIAEAYYKKTQKRHESAVKDNDFIYHARVPEYRLLEPIEKLALARPAPLPGKFLPETTDLFEGMLPLSVQQAWQKLEAKKQETVGVEVTTIQEQTTALNAVLASLNLPASLEDAPGVDLPQSLQDKAKYVRQKGGYNYVQRLIQELPELLQRNKEILEEIDTSLKNEEQRDDELRTRFKDKWTRTPSSVLNKSWKEYSSKYRDVLRNAVSADMKVKEKFENHGKEILLLSNDSKTAIAEAIPTGYHGHNYSNSPCVIKLKQLMYDVNTLKTEREELIQKFKNADFEHMKNRFMEASASEGTLNDTAMIAEAIGHAFAPLQRTVRETNERQNELIKEIRATNEDFADLKGGSSSSVSGRDMFFSKLAAAYDAFNDLLRHLQEGTKFYNDLTQLLVSLQTKVDDFCYARKTEREELLKSLDGGQSNVSSSVAGENAAPQQQASAPSTDYYYPPPPLPTMPFSAYHRT